MSPRTPASSPTKSRSYPNRDPGYNEEEVKEAARLINESERPIVYFRGGVRSAAANAEPLRELLEKTGMRAPTP